MTPELCSIYVGPSWLKNLYFAYMLVLRAIIKTESYWSTHQFYTGNDAQDASVHEQVMLMIQAARYVYVCLFRTCMYMYVYHTYMWKVLSFIAWYMWIQTMVS